MAQTTPTPLTALRFRPEQVEILDGDPFKDDKFARKQLAETLTQLVRDSEDSFVLALDAPWGTGKTTFLRMWAAELRRANAPVIHFNAWENDFAQDPLACLLGEVGSVLRKMVPDHNAVSAIAAVKSLGGKILKRGVPVAVRVLTAGIIDDQTAAEIKESVTGLAEKVAEDSIADYERDRKVGEELRISLQEAVRAIPSPADGKAWPLVFIIDEIDRCRPSFAVELLERIKHFFAVPGVIFVLGLDRSALHCLLQTQYGANFNATDYLRRFIDFSCELPQVTSATFAKSLITRFHLSSYDEHCATCQGGRGFLARSITELSVALEFSPRTQEQFVARLGIVTRLIDHDLLHSYLLLPLAALLESDPETFREFYKARLNGFQIIRRWSAKVSTILPFLEGPRGAVFNAAIVVASALLRAGDKEAELAEFVPASVPEADRAGRRTTFNHLWNELRTKEDVIEMVSHMRLARQFSG